MQSYKNILAWLGFYSPSESRCLNFPFSHMNILLSV